MEQPYRYTLQLSQSGIICGEFLPDDPREWDLAAAAARMDFRVWTETGRLDHDRTWAIYEVFGDLEEDE